MDIELKSKRNWVVPRLNYCISTEYIRILNKFCNNNGPDLICEVLQNADF